MSEKQLLFVYGTLREGASNAWRVKEANRLGLADVEGILIKVDWYPGLILGNGGRVVGDVYEVGVELLHALDAFEGIGGDQCRGEYRRVKVEGLMDGETVELWVYEWLKGVEGYEVIEGDWLKIQSG